MYIYSVYILYKVGIIVSTKSPSLSSHFIPPLCKTLYASCLKLIAEASGLFAHTHCGSAHCLPKGIVRVHPSGSQKDRSQGVLNWVCREPVGGQSISLLQLPAWCAEWCAVWRCHAGWLDLSFCLARCFEFVVLASLMPLCSELIVVSLSLSLQAFH